MRRTLLRSATLYTRNVLHSAPALAASTRPRPRLFSSNENPPPVPEIPDDVDNKELKARVESYFKGEEQVLPSIMEAILQRKLSGKHEETDDELMEELSMRPIDGVDDRDFESDFEELHDTDEEIDDLYNARDVVMKRMVQDEYFNMDDKKWDDIVEDGIKHGFLRDTKECEEILEDMLSWDKLLPDEIKQKVEIKFNELGDMCERGELEPEEAYEQFKKFEDEMVAEYMKIMEKEEVPQFDDSAVPDKKNDLDDPPGEGPILRWQTRVVFAPGGDAWHPKNRKVKLSVTVKELGLSKYQFRRLRELVGKRYHPGRDELTITSERFEHREENRKDCLRTLLSLIEEAGKANKLVDDARSSYVKERLRANPAFMERLHAKSIRLRESNQISA
ncbi:37S ribosomal protein S24 [Spatholobus suberectus]|nr:37S ribosomal protein S24 [Spatholobus suberectus]